MPAVVILTRFNLYMKFGDAEPPNLNRDWLERRVQLFEHLCQPSVANQTYKDFRWLVMLDPRTPQDIVDRLNSLQAVDARGVENPEHKALGRMLAESVSDDWIITANLDSDDMLHRDFVKDLVESFQIQPPREKTFLVFPTGYTVAGGKYYRMEYLSNQFRAIAEPVSDCETVFAVDHHKVGDLPNVRVVNDRPRWAMIVHGTNVANKIIGVRDLSAEPADFAQPVSPSSVGDVFDVPVSWLREQVRRTGIVGRIRRLAGRKT